ncbi:MAG: ATP-binding protein [Bacteroidia bacterium]|nr:MAG: ATP-binding protein [Bacteroidia bacterium]
MISKKEISQIIADQQKLGFRSGDLPRLGSGFPDQEITVVSGVRRCGKSTLLHEIRANNSEKDYYFNFDDERLINFTVDDFHLLYEVFIELFGKQTTFYFDEIQNVVGWERFVRRLHDYKNKVYVTGSNASMLSRDLGTHLTGRYCQQELFPFSFAEFLEFQSRAIPRKSFLSTEERVQLHSDFLNYFRKGGFPAYLQSGNSQYLKSLYESIIYRDVMVRNSLTNEKEILELVHYIASNVSKLFSYNSLTKVIGVKNATTVKSYLGFLENTYLVFLVSKYDFSIKKQIQNPKKIYFIDLGILRELGFHHSEDSGRLLENLVFVELKRRGKEIYYHSQKHECDFLIKEKNRIVEAIQVSWSIYNQTTREREIKGLIEALTCYNLKKGLILTDDEEDDFIMNDFRITVMPAWKWLLSLG